MEVVDAVLDRMERLEPILHAFCWPTPFVPPRRPRESRRSATAWHHQATEGQAARVEEVAWLDAAAYSLYGSRRGSDEARGAGLSTGQISRGLYVSEYTVQNHLRNAFEEVGMRSCRGLMKLLFLERTCCFRACSATSLRTPRPRRPRDALRG